MIKEEKNLQIYTLFFHFKGKKGRNGIAFKMFTFSCLRIGNDLTFHHAPKQNGVNKTIIRPLNCLYIYFSLRFKLNRKPPQINTKIGTAMVRDWPLERRKVTYVK